MGPLSDMMKLLSVLALAMTTLASVAVADPTAARTLKLMVSGIKAGKFDNNFFTGDFLQKASAKNIQNEVGSCLLDKAGAIKNEDGLAKFLNDLKVDWRPVAPKAEQQQRRSASRMLTLPMRRSPSKQMVTVAKRPSSSVPRP